MNFSRSNFILWKEKKFVKYWFVPLQSPSSYMMKEERTRNITYALAIPQNHIIGMNFMNIVKDVLID
jgi:hypothetical protein